MTQQIKTQSAKEELAPSVSHSNHDDFSEGPLYHAPNVVTLNFLAVFSVCVLIWLLKPGLSTPNIVQVAQSPRCNEGYYELDGRCYRDREVVRYCQNLDPCASSCECSSDRGMACNSQNICTFDDEYSAEQFCRQPGTIKFVQELEDFNRKCHSKTPSMKDAIGCPAEDFEKFLLEYRKFHRYFKEFNRNAVSLHFRDGEPHSLEGERFSEIEKHMKAELETSIAGLNAVNRILLVGTSSRSGRSVRDRQNNITMTQRRMAAVRKMLVDSGVKTEIIPFPLADKRPLTPKDFADLGIRYIAWNRSEGNFLRVNLEKFEHLPPTKQEKVEREINQAVFIIPIPCSTPGGSKTDGD